MSNFRRKKKVLELKKRAAAAVSGTPPQTNPAPKNTVKEDDKQNQKSGIASVSLKNLLSGNNDSGNVSDKPASYNKSNIAAETNKTVSESDLQQTWNDYAAKIKTKNPHLYSILAHRKPDLSNDVEIKVELVSQSQERELTNEKEEILSFLRNKLENSHLKLITIISDKQNPELSEAVTSTDKLKAMAKKNPALEKLVLGLNLDME